MPKLWNETIEAHRDAVREAIVEATAGLLAKHGPLSLTMSQVAEETGIGRATLYKYFPDVESILVAWHERHVSAHLRELVALCDRPGAPGERLEAVLEAYARIEHEHHGTEIAALLHRGEHVNRARHHLRGLFGKLLTEGARGGAVRDDVPPDELALYCLRALTAASSLPSKAAVRRLVEVVLLGVRGPR